MNSPIKWQGGKRNLRNKILPLIPEHSCYVEPFAGGLWVLFGKEKSKVEAVNDFNSDLINFYNVLKYNIDDFQKQLEHYLVSREEFEYLKNVDESNLDEVSAAYRFYYLNKNSFGGKMQSFNSYHRDKPYLNDKALKLLNKVHDRLKNVWIENINYIDMIDKFDKKETFFYLDPPYYQTDNTFYTNKNIDFEEMKLKLDQIKGKFMLSINDDEYIKELFKDYNFKNFDIQYGISKDVKGRGTKQELLITNY